MDDDSFDARNLTTIWEGPDMQYVHLDRDLPGSPICVGDYGRLDEVLLGEDEAIAMALAILKHFEPDRVRY